MPFSISVNIGTRRKPNIIARKEVVAKARASGVRNPENFLAVTIPELHILSRDLYKRKRFPKSFSVDGNLRLTLFVKTFIANDLSSCVQGVWASHEEDHVKDYEFLMKGMQSATKRNYRLKPYINSSRWYPHKSFSSINGLFHSEVLDIFRTKVREANRKRDTIAEYKRVSRKLLATCSPYFYEVQRKDTLSLLARFFYGNARHWPTIYRANKQLIGNNPDQVYPGQRLLIPKSPAY